MEHNHIDARERVLNPEKYVIECIRYLDFYYENNKLIYRSLHNNIEIDFTSTLLYQYKDDNIKFTILPIDNSKPVIFNELIIKRMHNIIEEINKEKSLYPFKKVLEIFSSLFEEEIFIEADREEKVLFFHKTKPSYRAMNRATVKLKTDGGIVSNKYIDLSLDTRLQIKKMSEYLVEQVLCTQEDLMNEALE